MTNPLPILDEPWSKVPPDAQAAIAAVFLVMQQRIVDLENRVADLEARLKLNSTNSHKPPSSDFIGAKRKPPAPPTGKKRGGQPKHRKAHRALVPLEKVREAFPCKPTTCRRCGHGLLGGDPTPLIRQVAELPKVEPIVDEYRLHRLVCPGCGETTCGTLPPGVPGGGFGPSLQAVLTVCAGSYRLSRLFRNTLGDRLSRCSPDSRCAYPPDDPERLAAAIRRDLERHASRVRDLFDRCVGAASGEPPSSVAPDVLPDHPIEGPSRGWP